MSEADSKLPELCQGELTPELLGALVVDLTTLTQIESVLLKGGEFTMAERSQMKLAEAVDLLRSKKVRGVQVHYSWDGVAWLDTLLHSETGIKVVRMPAPVCQDGVREKQS